VVVVDTDCRVEDPPQQSDKCGGLNRLMWIVVNDVAGNRRVMMCNLDLLTFTKVATCEDSENMMLISSSSML
jgi:hypothetical protein